MYLKRLKLSNFGCFESLELDTLSRLAVIVGENDCGKTVLLDAIELLLRPRPARADQFRQPPGKAAADAMSVEGEFELEDHDKIPDQWRCGPTARSFILLKTYTAENATCEVVGQGFTDDRFDGFDSASAARQKELLREHGVAPGSNKDIRAGQRDELAAAGKLTLEEKRMAVPFNQLAPYLPALVRVSAKDYQQPELIVQETLRRAAQSVIAPPDPKTGVPTELPELTSVRSRIEQRLNQEIGKAKETLKAMHPALRDVAVEPQVDFERSVSASNLRVDTGDGERLLDSFGEGTKRRLWMGLMEWNREVSAAAVSGSVIRLYDEPDVNLHYKAQRQLFASISEMADTTGLRTQCIVCTHAVTLIDRAPLESLTLLSVEADHSRTPKRVQGSGDPAVSDFYDEVASSVGLSNVALLYERAFLVFEGPSEQEALQILYRFLFTRSLREDGIVLVNLFGCGGWRSVIQVLLDNRIEITRLLLDSDCQDPASSANITTEELAKIGLDLSTHVTFIGQKEFEDAFSSTLIISALDRDFPREDRQAWSRTEIDTLRTDPKFSDALAQMVRTECVTANRSRAKKPALARSIANAVTSENEIPSELRTLFGKIRTVAGIS